MIIRVIDDNGEYEIARDGSACNCGREKCAHAPFIRDIYQYGGYESRWALFSGLQKECRRGDIRRALAHGRALELLHRPKVIANYIARVSFEETRAPGLQRLLHGATWQDGVRLLCLAPKKWEMRSWHMPTKLYAYQESVRHPEPDPDPLRMFQTNLGDAVSEFIRIRRRDKGKRRRTEIAKLVDAEIPGTFIAEVVATTGTYEMSFYHWLMALGQHYGVTSPTPTLGPCEDKEDEPWRDKILMPRAYAYDIHVRRSKQTILRHWKDIQPGRPLPAGLDLRWSGTIISTLWRWAAYQQFGADYRDRDLPWEAVLISKGEWRMALEFEGYFYGKKFISKVEPDAWLEPAVTGTNRP